MVAAAPKIWFDVATKRQLVHWDGRPKPWDCDKCPCSSSSSSSSSSPSPSSSSSPLPSPSSPMPGPSSSYSPSGPCGRCLNGVTPAAWRIDLSGISFSGPNAAYCNCSSAAGLVDITPTTFQFNFCVWGYQASGNSGELPPNNPCFPLGPPYNPNCPTAIPTPGIRTVQLSTQGGFLQVTYGFRSDNFGGATLFFRTNVTGFPDCTKSYTVPYVGSNFGNASCCFNPIGVPGGDGTMANPGSYVVVYPIPPFSP